jgi:hypothetical protein
MCLLNVGSKDVKKWPKSTTVKILIKQNELSYKFIVHYENFYCITVQRMKRKMASLKKKIQNYKKTIKKGTNIKIYLFPR